MANNLNLKGCTFFDTPCIQISPESLPIAQKMHPPSQGLFCHERGEEKRLW